MLLRRNVPRRLSTDFYTPCDIWRTHGTWPGRSLYSDDDEPGVLLVKRKDVVAARMFTADLTVQGRKKQPLIYTDETCEHSSHSARRNWQSDEFATRVPCSKGSMHTLTMKDLRPGSSLRQGSSQRQGSFQRLSYYAKPTDLWRLQRLDEWIFGQFYKMAWITTDSKSHQMQ